MILSFKDKQTRAIFETERSRLFSSGVVRSAVRKLTQLDVVEKLDDLKVPPGNHLETLKGDRKGQYSIRVNDQYRICFRWTDDGVHDVEIADYH